MLTPAPLLSQALDMHGAPNGTKWVVSDFNARSTKIIEHDEMDPFGVQYKQKWPATPYSVKCGCNYPGSVAADVHVDGRFAASSIMFNGEKIDYKGFQSKPGKTSYTKDSVAEFLFTLPRAAP
jgi:hypothetical protein